MARPGPHEKIGIELRRAKVAKLLSRGITNRAEIARQVPCTLKIAKTDVDAVYDDWRTDNKLVADKAVRRQLSEIAELRAECWAAWEKSKQRAVKEIVAQKTDADGTEHTVSRTTEEQCGDPRYLAVLNQLADREAKLLGMYAAEKSEHQVTTRVVVVKLVTKEDVAEPIMDVIGTAVENGYHENGVNGSNGHAGN